MAVEQRLFAVGVSHHTAPIEIRERLAVATDAVPGLLERLRTEGLCSEAILLSTCNRVELYTVPPQGEGNLDKVTRWVADTAGAKSRQVESHLYKLQDQDALRHIFRVASSLDSMVIGEPQILGQFKVAYRTAQDQEATGPVMHRVMDRALTVAKRVRAETEIAREAVSVGRSGVELARQVLGELKGRSAMLIGAGSHGKVVARSLLDYGLSELVIANRTFERAADLALTFGGSAVPFAELERYLTRVDIVLCSTAAGRVLISRDDMVPAMTQRRNRPLVMVDLAVPRNIDPRVHELDGVFRFDVDDLAKVAGRGMEKRRQAAEEAERIVEAETERYWRHIVGEAVHQRIGGIVSAAEAVRVAELARTTAALDHLDPEQREALDAMTRAIVKKILHQPLSQVRSWAENGDLEHVESLFAAFGEVQDEDA